MNNEIAVILLFIAKSIEEEINDSEKSPKDFLKSKKLILVDAGTLKELAESEDMAKLDNDEVPSMIAYIARCIKLDITHAELYPDEFKLFKKFLMFDVEKLKEIANMLKTE